MRKRFKSWQMAVTACAFSAFYLLLIKALYVFYYGINDDYNMRNIVSGAFTGIPDAHMIHIKYPVGCVLKLLYQISQSINWYGLFLIGIHFLGLFLLTWRILNMGKTLKDKICLTALFYALYSTFVFQELIALQYTTTGAFLAGTALFWVATGETGKFLGGKAVEIGVPAILTALLYCIRWDVFLVEAAFLLVLYAGMNWELLRDICVKKKMEKSVFYLPFALLICLGICLLIEQIGYHSAGWQDFLHFNEVREELYDYNQIPEYEENQQVYESLGIDEHEYQALLASNMSISGIEDLETYDILLEEFHALPDATPVFSERVSVCFHTLLKCLSEERLRAFHFAMLLFGILSVLAAGKNKRYIIVLLVAVALTHSAMMVYLCWRGRVVYRAVFTVYCMSLLSCMGIFIKCLTGQEQKNRLEEVLFAVLALGLCVTAGMNYREYKKVEEKKIPMLEAAAVFKDYFENHPDNFYFIDTHSFSGFMGTINLKDKVVYQNYMRLGDWVAYSPVMYAKMEKEGYSSMEEALLEPNVYVVTIDENDLGYLKGHYKEQYENFHCSIVDVMTYDEFHLYVYKYCADCEEYKVLDCSAVEKVVGHINSPDSADAIDGNRDTCWTSGEPQKKGMTFDINLNDVEKISGICLDVMRYEDRPRCLRIFASSDNTDWKELNVTTNNSIEFFFEPEDIKYIRLILGEEEETEWNWSIAELTLFSPIP